MKSDEDDLNGITNSKGHMGHLTLWVTSLSFVTSVIVWPTLKGETQMGHISKIWCIMQGPVSQSLFSMNYDNNQ